MLLLLLLATAGRAQGTGTVTGRVVDQTDLAMPGVTAQLLAVAAGTQLETVTQADGTYLFEEVPEGPVQLTFRLINFSTVRRELVITLDGLQAMDVVMIVSSSADITVTAPRTFRNLAELENPEENLVGIAGAGSEGAITSRQLDVRPVNRATEILETVPGMVISQHSGEGKANQYYLRGFNLDHGFDFGQTVAGIPVNMPTHAHSQGYADSNFLIPELVGGVQFRKGPYYAENGDFSSAGSANINYFNVLPRPIARFTTGSFGYRRFLGAVSPRVASGNLLAAFEYAQDDGPWERPNRLEKVNGVLRYSQGDTRNGLSVTFMGYQNRWNSTDQIPQRAVDSGLINRFGFIEGTDRGDSSRYSGAVDWQRSGITTSTRVIGYLQRYSVQLFHNFTYFLNDPINGDQFEQFEERWTSGAKVTHRRMGRVAGNPSESAVGIDFRNDSVGGPLGLYLTAGGERLSTARADEADQYSIGVFGQTEIEWSRVVRTVFGLRGDLYHWDVTARRPRNSGKKTDGILSPKVSAVFGPWRGTELYANWGLGFHSNSALGIMLSEDPFTGVAAEASPTFARAHGTELGVRTVALPQLQTTATFWYLDFDSELIYVGDSGSTEDGPGSRRLGVEITNYFYPSRWTTVDLDVSFSRARFVDLPDGENFVPGALNRVIAAGVAVAPPEGVAAGPFGSIRLRHFGPRPLVEDNSVKSESTSIANGEVGYKFSDQLRLVLEGFNLLDSEVSDIDYFFESRLRDEPGPVEDIHFHAAIPRSARLAVQLSF
jgi:hypothetical protein